jgi:hypothetical protein
MAQQGFKVMDAIRAVFIVGAVVAVIVILIGHLISGGGPTWTARVDQYRATSATDLLVIISISNTGTKAGIPTCTITAHSTSSAYSGSRVGTLSHFLAPHQTATASITVAISGHGARHITRASVQC